MPGYTRAVGIVQPVAVAHREDPATEDVELVPVGPTPIPRCSACSSSAPAPTCDGWPGKNAECSTFVGRVPLAAGAGTCVVVAVQAPLQPGRVGMPRPSDEELRQMREWAVNGVLVTTIIGKLSDGAIALIDLRADTTVATTIDAALGG